MAQQYQSSSGIADFQKSTFSFWFQIPSSAAGGFSADAFGALRGGAELVTFGDPSNSLYGAIALSSFSPFSPTDPIHASAPVWCIYAAYGQTVGGGDYVGVLDIYDSPSGTYVGGFGAPTSETVVHAAFLPGTFTFDVWHHVMVAADTSIGDTITDDVLHHPPFKLASRGNLIEIYFDTVRISGSYLAITGFSAPDTPMVVPVTQKVHTHYISLPTFPLAPYALNPKIRYAEFQAWTGQYIAPAANMSKFVSGGHPVPTTTAAAAFGPQTLLFKGNKDTFHNNLGTGGAFVKTGTQNNFSPGP